MENLFEETVDSSWIAELDYEDAGNVIMELLSGRRYRIYGVPEDIFQSWLQADSKGKFWHAYLRGMYQVIRVA